MKFSEKNVNSPGHPMGYESKPEIRRKIIIYITYSVSTHIYKCPFAHSSKSIFRITTYIIVTSFSLLIIRVKILMWKLTRSI